MALAGLAALLVGRIVASAESARNRWGDIVEVPVVGRAVAVDGELAPIVEMRSWPRSLVPDDVVAADELPDDARAAVPLEPGTPLTDSLLSVDPEQRRDHVAVRTAPGSLPLRAGDRVSVWATFDPSLAGDGPTTRRIAANASVISSDEERSVVAVHPDDTARVVEALVLATVTLVSEPR